MRKMSGVEHSMLNCPQSKASLEHHNKLVVEAENSDDIMEMIPILKLVLHKSPQLRTTNQNKLLDKFTKVSSFFNTIANYTSFEVARNILKNAKIFDILKYRTLIEKDSYINDVIILMSGKFGIVQANQPNKSEVLYKEDQIYKKIIENSLHILRDIKRRTKQIPQNLIETEFKTTKASMMDLTILNTIQENQQIFNVLSLMHGKKYSQTIVTCQQSIILTINAKIFYQNLSQYVKKLKHDKISVFKQFQFFQCVDDYKLIHLVDQFPLVTLKKGQSLYKQGNQVNEIYLLIKGSIKITKTAKLFKQNPNQFYMDRQKIQPNNRLQFVDFSSVYNYKPRTKLFQIGINNAISIIGQQQLFSQSNLRQVNAQINSETATFYVIQLNKLQKSLPDLKNFIQGMKQILYINQTKKKIMYRQQKLAELLMCENKSNMDYFFIAENSEMSEQIKLQNSPKKYKINKVNQQVIISNASTIFKQQKPKQTSSKDASYNSFNFNKFPLYASVSSRRKKQSNAMEEELTKQQSKILQLVHTIQLKPKTSNTNILKINNNKQKVDKLNKEQQSQKAKYQISKNKKFLIDIHNPLFEMQYFTKGPTSLSSRKSKQSRIRPLSSRTRASKFLSSQNAQKSSIKRPMSARLMRSSNYF